METLTYSSGRASGCDSPGLLNTVSRRQQYHRAEGAASSVMPNRVSCLEAGYALPRSPICSVANRALHHLRST